MRKGIVRLLVSSAYLVVLGLMLTGSNAVGAGKLSGEDPNMQWDIVSLVGENPSVRPGGFAFAKASDGTTIRLSGSGTFSEGFLSATKPVSGGGTWALFDRHGVVTEKGSYEVTRLVSFTPAPGTLPAEVDDQVGPPETARAGLAIFRISYSDKSEGLLVVGSALPVGTPPTVFEGITVSKGYVQFWQAQLPTPGVDANRVMFHSISTTATQSQRVFGDRARLAAGNVRTWVDVDRAGHPLAAGVSVSSSALSTVDNLFDPTMLVLNFPEVDGFPYVHMLLEWNPEGHEPPGVYDLPHFDFHFYSVDSETRMGIEANSPGFELLPPSGQIPADYEKIPGGIPQMGAHWVDTTSPEFQGQTFTTTSIYGSYDGQVIFFEPMITLDFIEQRVDFSDAIQQPRAYPVSGNFYPLKYGVHFDESTQEHQITLEQFVER